MTTPLPTFVVIGAQKSGTRWLRWNLSKHPDVFAPSAELHFFNNREHYEDLGVDWYREQFIGWSGEPFVGEATPGYMMFRHHPGVVAARMAETIPNARLLAILRNPIDRVVSAMAHFARYEKVSPHDRVIERVRASSVEQDPLGLIAGGLYAGSLAPFRARFGEQLLVLLHDDARRDPRGVYECAVRHVGAPTGFVPTDVDEIVWSNQDDARRYEITLEERLELWTYFADDVASLEVMLDRDLSSWRPSEASRADRMSTQ
jgi:hypothetical protein